MCRCWKAAYRVTLSPSSSDGARCLQVELQRSPGGGRDCTGWRVSRETGWRDDCAPPTPVVAAYRCSRWRHNSSASRKSTGVLRCAENDKQIQGRPDGLGVGEGFDGAKRGCPGASSSGLEWNEGYAPWPTDSCALMAE